MQVVDIKRGAVIEKKSSIVYVDHTVLSLLSMRADKGDPLFENWHAANLLWRRLREEKIRLVTHGKDTEMDIILWLNKQGCCITDTLRAMESIKEFEAWGKDEKSRIQQYKQILVHFEEVEQLHLSLESDENDHKIEEALKLKTTQPVQNMDSELCMRILRACLADLGSWYTKDSWSDLKRTDYQLNWQILESALSNEGIEPVFYGAQGVPNRYLFGLLNRAVGLAKKSCGKLPVPESHSNFVVNMVLQKYGDDQASRGIRHLLHCVKSQIEFYVTINHHLAQGFNQNKTAFREHLHLASLNLELLDPRSFIARVVSEDKSV